MLMQTNTLKNLALSDTGFIFDPYSGKTFTANEVGIKIILALKNGDDILRVQEKILEEYDISAEQFERDFSDFLIQLKEQGLLQ